jgi:signal transduction histidine kinase/ActR/RegA family two-component response regulator
MSPADAETVMLGLAEALHRERDARVAAERLLEEKCEALSRAQGELQLARDEAVAASRAKSQFLANMSHELRTPLNAIIGYSEILAEETQEAGHMEYLPDLQRITAGGHHLLGLINDILDLSKVESGQMELYYETVELGPLIASLVEMVAPLMEKNGNRLTVSVPPELGSMRVDVTKLRQSLLNLLGNAAKFTRQGDVELSVARLPPAPDSDDDRIEFRVRDSGIGLSAEQLRELFVPFKQGETGAARRFGGTGLGLAITARFCKLLGGTLRADSVLGRGATFTLCLPAAPKSNTARLSPVAGPSWRSGPFAPRDGQPSLGVVLVVDDDPMARDVISRFLAREGYTVWAAADGEEALRLARQQRPMVITLDVLMPKMDGWSVLSHLRADAELQKIPVLIISIMGDRGLGEGLGAAQYLRKPVDRRELVKVLRSLAAPPQNENAEVSRGSHG